MKSVIAVPHAEIQRRIAEHKKEAARNPNRRGPGTESRHDIKVPGELIVRQSTAPPKESQ
jgi:hypothetical protein